MKDRILRACKKAKEIESRLFTEKDLRGLTNCEKEYIRDNKYRILSTLPNGEKIYLFVARQENGRKALYAITKRQSIRPSEHQISKDAYNYECWLIFLKKYQGFSRFYFERRFSTVKENQEVLIFA